MHVPVRQCQTDDLLVMYEADPQQPGQHFAGEFGSVPDIANLEVGQERDSF